MTTSTTTHISVQGLRTRHMILGDGDPLLLLHGWGANIDLIRPLAEQLAQHGLRTYALDLPGFGETDPPPKTWTVHDYAQFVLGYIGTQQLQHLHLFGHSFGGRLSLVLGAKHPSYFQKIILCDAAGVKPKQPWYRQFPITLYKSVEQLIGDIPIIRDAREQYRQRVGSEDYLSAGELRETFLAVISEDLLPFAPQITQPTLLLWGSADNDTPLWQAKQLEAAIPDAGLVVFQGAGHYSYLDALPDAVRVIHYFLTHDE